MRFLAKLGVPQAVLPPHPRPALNELRRLGFEGSDARVLQAASRSPGLLTRLSSASAMWTANAATVIPASDSADGKLHLAVANLTAMAHRSIEAAETHRILTRIFADRTYFTVHPALPTYLGDEGAANHLRLDNGRHAQHLFAWGRSLQTQAGPSRYTARQTLEASQALARVCTLHESRATFWQQHPSGIDHGAFHSDVLAVSNSDVLLLHELAFVQHGALLESLTRNLDGQFSYCLASSDELPVAEAVESYPFNSQLVSLPGGGMALVAPAEAQHSERCRAFLERAVLEIPALRRVHYIDVNASMNNGGGPACLRLRVLLSEAEKRAVTARVFLDDALYTQLVAWVEKHYRDRLVQRDLADPKLTEESTVALDELTQLMQIGSVFDFQTTSTPRRDDANGGP
jgi:succinylarginine dihydrolase